MGARALDAQTCALRGQLLGIANQQDGLGGYLFAGQGGTGAPFVQGPAGIEFKGVPGGMAATATEELPLYLDGAATWMQAPTGNGVFATSYAGAVAPAHDTLMWINAGQVVTPSALTGLGYELSFTGSASAGFTVSVEDDDGNVQTLPYVSGQALEFDGLSVTLAGTPVPGKDVFKIEPSARSLSPFGVVDGLIADLEAGGRTGAQRAQTVANGLPSGAVTGSNSVIATVSNIATASVPFTGLAATLNPSTTYALVASCTISNRVVWDRAGSCSVTGVFTPVNVVRQPNAWNVASTFCQNPLSLELSS